MVMKKVSILRLIATFIVAVMMLTMLVSCKTKQGPQGEQGTPGKDGVTPTIEISEDGYWVINGEKTDVKASPEESADGNLEYLEFTLSGYRYSVSWCDTVSDVVVIPSTYKGRRVSYIGASAFRGLVSLTSITIPDSVTYIGAYAFLGCTSLTSINFEGTVEQWNNISKEIQWNYEVPATEVICSDGTVTL